MDYIRLIQVTIIEYIYIYIYTSIIKSIIFKLSYILMSFHKSNISLYITLFIICSLLDICNACVLFILSEGRNIIPRTEIQLYQILQFIDNTH